MLRHVIGQSVFLYLFTAPIFIGSTALAQELVPGDSCTAGELEWIVSSGGPETNGTAHTMYCNGSVWETYVRFDSAGSVAIGNQASSVASSIAIGPSAYSDSVDGIGIGRNAGNITSGYSSIAIGTDAWNDASDAIAIGNGAYNDSDRAIAIGTGVYSDATALDTIVIGTDSGTGNRADESLTIGKNTYNDGYRSYTFGSNNMIPGNSTGYIYLFGSDIDLAGPEGNLVVFNLDGGTTLSPRQSDSFIISGGNVGINKIAPAVALDVVGDIHYTGVLQDMSDMRYKENVAKLEGSLSKLIELSGYSFTMKGDKGAKVEYGVSAQEVKSVFPELVDIHDKSSGALGVSYNGLIAPIIEAVKEQQIEIESLRREGKSDLPARRHRFPVGSGSTGTRQPFASAILS